VSSRKCALTYAFAVNQETERFSRSYLQEVGGGGATRIQLRASARETVKALIPRKMGTPRLPMRMVAVLEDEACHEDISIGIGRKVFISGNERTIILFRETGVPELNLDRKLQLPALNNPV
jgi:hypothetical protein